MGSEAWRRGHEWRGARTGEWGVMRGKEGGGRGHNTCARRVTAVTMATVSLETPAEKLCDRYRPRSLNVPSPPVGPW